MSQRCFVVRETSIKIRNHLNGNRTWHQRSYHLASLVFLILITFLNACGNISLPQIIFESPSDNGRAEELLAYDEVTQDSHKERAEGAWFKVYFQASSLTGEERNARLLALNSMLKQPDKNQSYLALEQATLLGVTSASIKEWTSANNILKSLPDISPDSDAGMYKNWLHSELEMRLQKNSRIRTLNSKNSNQANEIKQLKSEINHLNSRIEELNDQINALTNIEQNLTEKQSVQ